MMRIIVVLVLLVVALVGGSDPTYDHQTVTYNATVAPVQVTANLTVSPFFSPDHSVDTLTNLVTSAKTIIKIATPGWDSWNGCTDATSTSYGCTVANQRSTETFPIFRALLNALHKGITVEILTNNMSQPYFPNYIDPLGFLKLAGANVRYFTTVTFLHEKYISVDGTKASVSSVNFSKTSFLYNREAGVLIQNSSQILAFLDGVFDADFAQAIPWVTPAYSASDLAIIANTSLLSVTIPKAKAYNNSYVSPNQTVSGQMTVQAYTSPDLAYTTLTAALNSSSTVDLYIYQITGDMCTYIINHASIFSKILVSNAIDDSTDENTAQTCYAQLYNLGLTIRMTALNMYTFSHQKYWIVNGTTVFLSTGNWGTTDYPTGGSSFTSYAFSHSKWRSVNRDFTMKIVNPSVLKIFQTVFDSDYAIGYDWSPASTTTPATNSSEPSDPEGGTTPSSESSSDASSDAPIIATSAASVATAAASTIATASTAAASTGYPSSTPAPVTTAAPAGTTGASQVGQACWLAPPSVFVALLAVFLLL